MFPDFNFDLVLTDTKQRPPSTEKRLRVADMRVSYQKNTPGITIDPVDKAPQSRRSGAGVEASIDAAQAYLRDGLGARGRIRGPLGLRGWALGRLRLKRLKTCHGKF